MDAFSRQGLTRALRAAAGGHAAPLPAFAAATRDLFRHAAPTLAARHRARARRRCFGHPARNRRPDPFIPAAAPLHHDLLAAIGHLRRHARLRPRLTVVQGAEADGSLQEALSALRSLFDAVGDHLEQVLQPLTLPVGRHALHAFILETRREVDDLAACHAAGEAYAECLSITEPDDKSVSIEVEASLGAAAP